MVVVVVVVVTAGATALGAEGRAVAVAAGRPSWLIEGGGTRAEGGEEGVVEVIVFVVVGVALRIGERE